MDPLASFIFETFCFNFSLQFSDLAELGDFGAASSGMPYERNIFSPRPSPLLFSALETLSLLLMLIITSRAY